MSWWWALLLLPPAAYAAGRWLLNEEFGGQRLSVRDHAICCVFGFPTLPMVVCGGLAALVKRLWGRK